MTDFGLSKMHLLFKAIPSLLFVATPNMEKRSNDLAVRKKQKHIGWKAGLEISELRHLQLPGTRLCTYYIRSAYIHDQILHAGKPFAGELAGKLKVCMQDNPAT